MRLVDVYSRPDRADILYRLLGEREGAENISHRSMPSMEAHIAFIEARPYAVWLFLVNDDEEVVGACYLSKQNEIGIFVFRVHRRNGYAATALKMLVREYKPLPAIPSVRVGQFLANINPKNAASLALFESLGFELRQLTYELPP